MLGRGLVHGGRGLLQGGLMLGSGLKQGGLMLGEGIYKSGDFSKRTFSWLIRQGDNALEWAYFKVYDNVAIRIDLLDVPQDVIDATEEERNAIDTNPDLIDQDDLKVEDIPSVIAQIRPPLSFPNREAVTDILEQVARSPPSVVEEFEELSEPLSNKDELEDLSLEAIAKRCNIPLELLLSIKTKLEIEDLSSASSSANYYDSTDQKHEFVDDEDDVFYTPNASPSDDVFYTPNASPSALVPLARHSKVDKYLERRNKQKQMQRFSKATTPKSPISSASSSASYYKDTDQKHEFVASPSDDIFYTPEAAQPSELRPLARYTDSSYSPSDDVFYTPEGSPSDDVFYSPDAAQSTGSVPFKVVGQSHKKQSKNKSKNKTKNKSENKSENKSKNKSKNKTKNKSKEVEEHERAVREERERRKRESQLYLQRQSRKKQSHHFSVYHSNKSLKRQR
jgi:hypothetical protein